ncbi:hypothetical protein L218DRAFT_1005638 [Marasmius fiardii PR-910]|nr:hypothetical protein L218DRAFT_1005638 [Marasmius fiardii PR-910]
MSEVWFRDVAVDEKDLEWVSLQIQEQPISLSRSTVDSTSSPQRERDLVRLALLIAMPSPHPIISPVNPGEIVSKEEELPCLEMGTVDVWVEKSVSDPAAIYGA